MRSHLKFSFVTAALLTSVSLSVVSADTYDVVYDKNNNKIVYYKNGDTLTPLDVSGDFDNNSELSAFQNNTVNVDLSQSNTTHYLSILGAKEDIGLVEKNTLNFNGGTLSYYVVAGWATNGTAQLNTLNLNGGKVQSNIHGGFSDRGQALNNTVNITDGYFDDIFAGRGYSKSIGNKIIMNGGDVRTLHGGYIYEAISNSEVSGNSVLISGGKVRNNVYGGFSYHNVTNTINNTVSYAGGQVNGTIYGGSHNFTGNTLNIGESAAKPLSKDTTLSAENIANFETINFYLVSDIDPNYTALKLTTSDTTDLSKSSVYAYINNAKNLKNDSIVHLITTNGMLIPHKNNLEEQSTVKIANLLNVKGYTTISDDLKNLNLVFNKPINYIPADKTYNIISNTNYTRLVKNENDDSDTKTQSFILNGNFDDELDEVSGNTVNVNGGSSYSRTIYGGKSDNETVENNIVNVKPQNVTSYVANAVYGGYSDKGIANANTVNIDYDNGGYYKDINYVYGGYSNSSDATNNVINISNGYIDDHVYGGYSNSSDATNNVINISNGYIDDNVYTGYSNGGGNVTNNKFEITGGNASRYNYAGYSVSGDATQNTFIISGGQSGEAKGGWSRNGMASNNSVIIKGGKINGDVFGGYIYSDKGANDNTVTYSGGEVTGVIYGGDGSNSGVDYITGNTLNIGESAAKPLSKDTTLSAGNIANFETINFYLASDIEPNYTALKLTGIDSTDLSKSNVYAYINSATNLKSDSIVHLITTNGNLIAPKNIDKIQANVSNLLNLDSYLVLSDDLKNLNLSFVSPINYIPADKTYNIISNTNYTRLVKNENDDSDTKTQSFILNGNFDDELDEVSGNTVNVNGGSSYSRTIYGGKSDNETVENNIVNVNLQNTNEYIGYLYGGYSQKNNAIGNTININGGNIYYYTYGGYTATNGTIVSNNTITMNDGYASNAIIGGEANSGGKALNNAVYMKGGSVNHIHGGIAYSDSSEISNNKVIVSGGTVRNNVAGGSAGSYYSAIVKDNTVTYIGGEIKGIIYGGVGQDVSKITGNTLNIGESAAKPLSKDTTLSAGNIANFETINFYLASDIEPNYTALKLTGIDSTDLSKSNVYAYINSATNLKSDSIVHLITTNGNLIAPKNIDKIQANVSNLLNLDSYLVLSDDLKNLNLSFVSPINYIPADKTYNIISNTNYTRLVKNENDDSDTKTQSFILNGNFDDELDEVSGNTVNVNGGSSSSRTIYGGKSDNEAVENNIVNVKPQNVTSNVANAVYGGYSDKGIANANTVNIDYDNGGYYKDINYVYGGYSNSSDATNNVVNISNGYIDDHVYGGVSYIGSVKNNTVNVTGGSVGYIVVGDVEHGSGEGSGNTLNISGGTIRNNAHAVYLRNGSGDATNNITNISGGTIEGLISNYSSGGNVTNNTITYSGGEIKGGISGGFSSNTKADVITGNTLNIGESAAKPLSKDTTLSAENIANFETINFYLVSDIDPNYTALKLTTSDTTDLSKSSVYAYINSATNLDENSLVHLISTNGSIIAPKNEGEVQANVNLANLLNLGGIVKVSDDLKNLDLTFEEILKWDPKDQIYNIVSNTAYSRMMVSEKGDEKLKNFVLKDDFDETDEVSANIININLENETFQDKDIYGGKATNEDAQNNIVNFNSGILRGVDIYGGNATDGDAKNNTVNVSGENARGDTAYIYGGYANNGNAIQNSVNISETISGNYYTYNQFNIYGGYANGKDLKANENTVNIDLNKGSFYSYYGNSIYGGYAQGDNAEASNNKIYIKQGYMASATIYGGYATGSNSKAQNNEVIISGGSINNVYGGYANTTSNNIVTFTGGSVAGYIDSDILNIGESKDKLLENLNTLKAYSLRTSELNFYIKDNPNNGDVALLLDGHSIDLTKTKINISNYDKLLDYSENKYYLLKNINSSTDYKIEVSEEWLDDMQVVDNVFDIISSSQYKNKKGGIFQSDDKRDLYITSGVVTENYNTTFDAAKDMDNAIINAKNIDDLHGSNIKGAANGGTTINIENVKNGGNIIASGDNANTINISNSALKNVEVSGEATNSVVISNTPLQSVSISKGDLEISNSTINGDITGGGDITATTINATGNVNGNTIILNGDSSISKNIVADNEVTFNDNSYVKGNVDSKTITINGKFQSDGTVKSDTLNIGSDSSAAKVNNVEIANLDISNLNFTLSDTLNDGDIAVKLTANNTDLSDTAINFSTDLLDGSGNKYYLLKNTNSGTLNVNEEWLKKNQNIDNIFDIISDSKYQIKKGGVFQSDDKSDLYVTSGKVTENYNTTFDAAKDMDEATINVKNVDNVGGAKIYGSQKGKTTLTVENSKNIALVDIANGDVSVSDSSIDDINIKNQGKIVATNLTSNSIYNGSGDIDFTNSTASKDITMANGDANIDGSTINGSLQANNINLSNKINSGDMTAKNDIKLSQNVDLTVKGDIKANSIDFSNAKANISGDIQAQSVNFGDSTNAMSLNSISANNISASNVNFYLPNSVANGDVALSLTTTKTTDLSNTKINTYLSDASGLSKDDKIHLIQTKGTISGFNETNANANLSNVNIANLINVEGKILLSDAKNLDLTFTGEDPNANQGGDSGNTGGGSNQNTDSGNNQGGNSSSPTGGNGSGNNQNQGGNNQGGSTPSGSNQNQGGDSGNTGGGNNNQGGNNQGGNSSSPTGGNNNQTPSITPKPKPQPIQASADENSKQLLETNLAGIIAVNEGANLLSANLDKIVPNGENSDYFAFAFASGADKRFETGSYVESKGFNVNAGIASQSAVNNADITTGVFVEYGKSDFESHLDNGLVGEGDASFVGGGAFAKYQTSQNLYFDASLRVGRVKTNSDKGLYDEFDLSQTYYGAHAGLGAIFNITNANSLDIYAKYFYSHLNSADTVLSGVNVAFDSVNSHALKVGFKDSIKFDETNALYFGAAYKYEFDGEANANLAVPNFATASIASPKLKGSTGIGEIGYTYENGDIKFDIGAKGYLGKERGYSGNLGITFKF